MTPVQERSHRLVATKGFSVAGQSCHRRPSDRYYRSHDYGCDLRDLKFDNRDSLVITAETEDERYTAAVVLAAYVHIDPI